MRHPPFLDSFFSPTQKIKKVRRTPRHQKHHKKTVKKNTRRRRRRKEDVLPSFFSFSGEDDERGREKNVSFFGEVACRHRDFDSFIVSDERASARRREEKEEKEEENMW